MTKRSLAVFTSAASGKFWFYTKGEDHPHVRIESDDMAALWREIKLHYPDVTNIKYFAGSSQGETS